MTPLDEFNKSVPHGAEIVDLGFDLIDLVSRESGDIGTFRPCHFSQGEKLFDLAERKSKFLRSPDEPNDAHRLDGIISI